MIVSHSGAPKQQNQTRRHVSSSSPGGGTRAKADVYNCLSFHLSTQFMLCFFHMVSIASNDGIRLNKNVWRPGSSIRTLLDMTGYCYQLSGE